MTIHTLPQPAATTSTGIFGLVGKAARRVVALFLAYKNRRDLQVLASFDDHMLRDIGLTRGDLRDAVAEPLWRDPTTVLVIRARERRAPRGFRGAIYDVVKASRFGSAKPLEKAPPLAPANDDSSRMFPARSRYY